MRIKLFIIVFLILVASCKKDNDFGEQIEASGGYQYGNGFFIINEGNFNQGNGSVYFYNSDLEKLYKNIFQDINDRPLGDIPQSMTIINDKGYVVVNNSGKIEIVGLNDFLIESVIEGLPSPRFIHQIDQDKAYISDLKSTSMHVLDLNSNKLTGTIECGKSTDRMVLLNQRIFVCNWSAYYNNEENNTISVIDAENNDFIKYIEVTKEPNSIVLDKNNNIWVLCSGGFMNEERPSLYCINGIDHSIIKKLDFPDHSSNPTNLMINHSGDSLLFLNKDIFIMNLQSDTIPLEPLRSMDNRVINGFSTDPVSGNILIFDAIDYQQNGLVRIYEPNGTFIKNIAAGIIPGYITYNQP